MIDRKKKIKIIQLSLLVIGSLVLFLTYANKSDSPKEEIVSKEIQERIKNQNTNLPENSDIFYNIEYSGLDLAGNRYILKSKEAFNDKNNQEIVQMKFVEAFFYFKDDTVLEVKSDYGIYNNKTLNMNFKKNVKATYEGSELFAQEAEYSNVESFLTIADQVRVNDSKGTMFADKILFYIKKKKLNIASFNDNKINANINLK
ncbi:MAG: LPS export ABC transporter periplasmic protein LptC [Pseudomonadota bacterium]|nr:LPS export ABC transporter periplasmic protein LptC [Pseudomonadota bacterium]